ncbi:MAG: hypothetical protein A2Y10_14765 [Planctomycetes bacterium GWF2_41_51]|nr:MAG: hypothetical protein A2Y10_14765 [Planctomycetes bacterium GWF2_41_51]HBG28995.1 hypothetical protein [Phycisphaerales bacterium]
MEHKLNSLILLPIFIILLVVIFRTIKSSLNVDVVPSLIFSICMSILATIGLNSDLKGSMAMLMVPYKALAICVIIALLITFLFKMHKKAKDKFSDTFKKNQQSEINKK